MILDVKKLNALKEYSGEREFSFTPPSNLVDIPYVSFDGDAVTKIFFDILENGNVEVTGEIRYRLKGLCSRCLSETQAEIVGEVKALYVKTSDGEDYTFDGNRIDLTELFYDSIVWSMPRTLSCGEGCQGLSYEG